METETKELIELYKDGLRPLADYLDSYRKSKLTKPSKLGEQVRMLVSVSQKKYPKLDYKGLLEVMKSVDRTLDRIYGDHPCGPLIILEGDRELTVKNEADRLSRQFMGLGVQGIFYRFDAERLRYAYHQHTSVTDPQAVLLKNLGYVAKDLSEPMADQVFRSMATDLLVAIREVQHSGFRYSSSPYYTNMVLGFDSVTSSSGGLAMALSYRKRVETYQEMVHEMLKYCGMEPKVGREFSMDLKEYNLWLEDELHNLEELYLCITYQRILNVL